MIICAWCRNEIPDYNPGKICQAIITHGICSECADYFVDNRAGRTIHKFLNKFDMPILVMNGEGRVLFANNSALKVLQKETQEVEGRLSGDAIECAYAKLPEGCGKAEHCTACTIRKTVTE